MEIYGNRDIERDIDNLQKWFEQTKDLPNKIDRIYLARFYYRASQDVEETKKVLLEHFAIRKKNPNIYFNRDPNSQDTLNTAEFVYLLVLPGVTPDLNRVSIISIKNPDPKMMHFTEDIRSYIMVNDCRFSLPDEVIDGVPYFSEGVIQIIDMAGITMSHMARFSLRTLLPFMKYLQQVCPVVIKGIHLINCPTYVNRIFAVVKPFLKKEFIDMVHFHHNTLDTLYDYIPREMLPDEYGGNAGKIDDLFDDLVQRVREKRDYLMDANYWTIDKRKL